MCIPFIAFQLLFAHCVKCIYSPATVRSRIHIANMYSLWYWMRQGVMEEFLEYVLSDQRIVICYHCDEIENIIWYSNSANAHRWLNEEWIFFCWFWDHSENMFGLFTNLTVGIL